MGKKSTSNSTGKPTASCIRKIKMMLWVPLAAVIAAFFPALSHASGENDWVAGSGNWSTPSNWSFGVPGANQTADIVDDDGVARTITYDYTGPSVALDQLNVSLSGGTGLANETFSMNSNALLVQQYEFVGGYYLDTSLTVGVGTFNQSGGTNTITGQGSITGQLTLGELAGSTGTYNLSGGSLSAQLEQLGDSELGGIGNSGDGIFNQTGGTNTVSEGLNAQGASNYKLSGASTLTVSDGEQISASGLGGFTQTGGTNTTQGIPNLSSYPALKVNGLLGYQLSGNGTLTAIGANDEPAEIIGSGALGTFIQSGGTNNITNAGTSASAVGPGLYVGVTGLFGLTTELTGTGNYYLSGGSLAVSTNEYIGASDQSFRLDPGNGTFVQTGGTNTTANLVVAYNSGNGSYQLLGGTLSATVAEQVGDGGNGAFVQTAGSNTTASLSVGSTGYGSYQLAGGSLVVAGNENIGSTGSGNPYNAGQLGQYGGTNNITAGGNLNIVQGAYTLSDGALTISGQMNVGSSSSGTSFTQTGGILTVTGPINIGSGNTLSISGGFATAGSLLEQGIISFGIHDLTDFGQLHLVGAITLSNSPYDLLNLQLDPDYIPQYGDTFPILLGEGGGSVTGQFASITSNLPPSAGSFQIEYQPADNPYGIDVVFVPEPTCAGAILLLSTAALFHRPRKPRELAPCVLFREPTLPGL